MRRMANDLCADIGYSYINHVGEQLCGDHVELTQGDDSTIFVLADGLGSGVKASILSTLTSKIISTMLFAGMKLQDAVETIASTLPVCSVRGVAYSTFTIIRLVNNSKAEIIEYDNPKVIFFRNGKSMKYDSREITIDGKKIFKSDIDLEEGDTFIAFSDGVEHAGVGGIYNFGWRRVEIIEYMASILKVGFTAKTLSKILIDKVKELYDKKPGDDATAGVVVIKKRVPMNLLFGPPANRDDTNRMMSLFFARAGKHIVSGGTTSKIAAKYLGKPLTPSIEFQDPEIPPTAEIQGVDLVTEGVVTINRVLEYAKNYLNDNSEFEKWSIKQDGAAKISRLLFEEATDINWFVGRAINPAHQNPDLPINFSIKMQLVEELSDCLRKMGKKVKIIYF